MADQRNTSSNATNDTGNDETNRRSGTPRSSESDTPSEQSGHTKSGQESMRGVAPGAHDRERQSEYGGGGANGGSDGANRSTKK